MRMVKVAHQSQQKSSFILILEEENVCLCSCVVYEIRITTAIICIMHIMSVGCMASGRVFLISFIHSHRTGAESVWFMIAIPKAFVISQCAKCIIQIQ